MKLTSAQVDALAQKVVSVKRAEHDAKVKVARNSKEVKDKVKKAVALINDMQAQLDVLNEQTDGLVDINIKQTVCSWHSTIEKTLLDKFAEKVVGASVEESHYDIRGKIVLASIDTTTLDELGKKLGVKF
jgi:hypothetical protein